MSNLRKFNLFVVLILFIGIGTVIHAQDDTPKVDYSAVIKELTENPKTPLCVVPTASLDGQVWRASGTNGGLATTWPPPAPPAPTPNPNPNPETPYNYESNLAPSIGSSPVAILVVDSFINSRPTAEFNTLIATDLASGANAWDELDNNRFSHGDLVFGHIVSLLQGAGLEPDPASDFSIWTQGGIPLIYVVKVPAVNYTAGVQISPDSVASAIIKTINDIWNQFKVTQFVVNESFAIIPCVVVTSNTDASISFKDYLAGIVSQLPPGFGLADVAGLNSILNADSPLHNFAKSENGEYCKSLPIDIQATFVASSGNSGLNFPFVPAAWEEVIGVTDDMSLANGSAPYANAIVGGSSDVASVPGGWFQFTIPEPGKALPIEPLNLYYIGTSFSAPTYAVKVAFDSTTSPSSSAFNPCTGPKPSS